jgi:serine/threonine protein kinase
VGAKGVNHLELVLSCITYQVLWGLAYLHYEHNTHRDIKPGNILINYDGEVKLSDFGISRNLDNTVGMSNTAVGTCKYMSPERLEGLAYNETADIYAFGMVMLEIINNNCYPFGRGGSNAGSAAGGMFDDSEDGGIMSPIELLAELEQLDVNKLLDNYILPNINNKGGGGRICITEQLREFITGMMHYESNDRSSAL